MLYAPDNYAVVQDISTGKRNLYVAVESDTIPESTLYARRKRLDECVVVRKTEDGHYQLICKYVKAQEKPVDSGE